jgi:pimeloyl-ACP methyl ester carboxylesterase
MIRPLRRHPYIVPTTIACGFTLTAACGFALLDSQPALHQHQPRRSTLFDADLLLLAVDGHKAFILKPRHAKTDGPKPWVWYAPTLMTDREQDWISPGKRHAWMFNRLLEGGFYVVGVDVGESWGSPAGRAVYDKFYALLVDRFGFAPKACLFPVSRGGLMAYNWAADHPDRVRCIGGIYPLVNLRTFAGLPKVARAYRLSEAGLRTEIARHNPLARLTPLAEAGVRILHVQGDQDKSVPLETNSAELVRRYQALGGQAEVIVIPGKGHEIAPQLWQEPRLSEFFLRQR